MTHVPHDPAGAPSPEAAALADPAAAMEGGAAPLPRTRLSRTARAMRSAPPTAIFGMAVIAIYCIVALFAPFLAPYGEAENAASAYQPWSAEHPLGTDQIGRDVLTRLIYGARNTMGIALATTLLSFLIGGGLGLLAAISRGWTDQILSRFVDVLMAIPALIFALMLLSIFGSTVTSLIIIIAVLDSTRVFRLTRAVAMGVVVMDYVEAARLRGEGLGYVMRREILPNIAPPLVAEFGLRFSFVFLTIAALSFLGLGIQPPSADWGTMVRDGASLIQFAPYDLRMGLTPFIPAGAIALLTVSVNFVVDWLLHRSSGLKE